MVPSPLLVLQAQPAFLGPPETCRAGRDRQVALAEPRAPAGAGVRESPRVGVPGAWQRGAVGGGRSLQPQSLPSELWPHNPAPFPISPCEELGTPGATRARPLRWSPLRASPPDISRDLSLPSPLIAGNFS